MALFWRHGVRRRPARSVGGQGYQLYFARHTAGGGAAVFLLPAVAALIGATIMSLFSGETLAPHSERLVPWSFLGGIACFVLALTCFLVETLLATHTLRFAKPPARK